MQCSFVANVRDVGTREARREHGQLLCKPLDIRKRVAEAEAFEVNHEDAPAAVDIGAVDGNVPVEAARAHGGGVEDIGTVRAGDPKALGVANALLDGGGLISSFI